MKNPLLLFVLLSVLVIVAIAQDVQFVQHNLRRKEALCTDACLALYKSKTTETCMSACSEIVMKGAENVMEELKRVAAQTTVLSDSADAQDAATTQLWEMFHKHLRKLFSGGGYLPGLQLLPSAIDLTDISGQIPGWEAMPKATLQRLQVEDFDHPPVLARELIQYSPPGPFRITNGLSILDEYKGYLSGVQGVRSIAIPDPQYTESSKRTEEYQWASNNCTEKYMTASLLIMMRYDMDAFTRIFCPDVARAEKDMFAQIGIEQAYVGNNQAYGAAVALGLTARFSYDAAFKKYQSIRAMEYECLIAQQEGRPLRGNAKSFEFSYDYHSWKNTEESHSYSSGFGIGILSYNSAKAKQKVTGLDLTSIGGVEVSFQDFKFIPVHAGDWYSSAAAREFRFHPREPNAQPIHRYFGDSGSLSLFPKALYVAVNPTIGFHVESSKKDEFKEATSKSMGFGINVFGFSFGFGKAKSKMLDEGSGKANYQKVKIVSESCKPQMFAVDNVYIY